MSRFRALPGTLTLVAATALVTAAVTACVLPQHSDQAAQDDAWSKYCVRCPQHVVLDQLAGRWTLSVKVREAPGAEPTPSTVEADYRWTLGGRFLVGQYEGFVAGEAFSAKEVLGYDSFRQQYNSFWIDNSTTAFTLSKGRYDEKTKTLTFEGTQDNVESNVRDEKFQLVYGFPAPDQMSMELYRPGPDGKLVKRVEVKGMREE